MKEKFDELLQTEKYAEAALAAVEVIKELEEERRLWLRKLYGAIVQTQDKPLIAATIQILNTINAYPYDYDKLKMAVMESIVKNT